MAKEAEDRTNTRKQIGKKDNSGNFINLKARKNDKRKQTKNKPKSR